MILGRARHDREGRGRSPGRAYAAAGAIAALALYAALILEACGGPEFGEHEGAVQASHGSGECRAALLAVLVEALRQAVAPGDADVMPHSPYGDGGVQEVDDKGVSFEVVS